MYEEDRQTALAMYNRLFDEIDDEQGLLQLLVSPTRQAVVIARSYNAKERKLQVHAQSREEDGEPSDGSVPQFVSVINDIREEALSRHAPKVVEISADQFSMFEDDFYAPTPDNAAPAAEETPVVEAVTPAEAAPSADIPAEEAPAEAAAAPQADEAPADEAPADEPKEAAPAEAGEQEPAAAGTQPAENIDAVDAFLADFEIVDSELGDDEPAEGAAEVEEPEPPHDAAEEEDGGPLELDADDYDDEDYDYYDVPVVRKPRVFLLILYILLAIPVGLIGILVLSLLALVFLALAAGFIAVGVVAVETAFGGLPLFADIIVTVGAAFVMFALGLLTLWIAVWFIVGVIVGLVRGLIHLGGKWCYKEVEV